MFGFDDYDYYDYDSRHYSSSHLTTRPSSSRAAISGFQSERSVSARTQEAQEKDFTQIVLGWRLSTVREVYTGASVSQSLERNYTSRTKINELEI
ncbi:MAG: hypothetical protein KBD83_08340 [Gammaproteobacteria bacterium]|nr:hypothetical protein [Gammaproteobacteria bacterium]